MSILAYQSAAVVTRPANTTAYTAGDVIGGVVEFDNIGPVGSDIEIFGTELRVDVTAVPSGMANIRLHLYNVTPPSAIADNAAWDLPSGDRAAYLGYLDLGTPVDLGSTLYVQVDNATKQLRLATGTLFGYLQTIAGFTPAANSEVYNPRLKSRGV